MNAGEIREQFDAAAPTYGGWHRRYAERLLDLTPLKAGQRVLDVGTGTGLAALAAARTVGPSGQVVGIDLAERMIEQARAAARNAGLGNITFVVGDGGSLSFAPRSFDAVVCSSAIIYSPLPTAVQEWARVLRPKGTAAFSTLRHDSPRTGVVFREVAASFDVPLDNPNAIGTHDACGALMRAAGFDQIEISQETIEGDTSSAIAAWEGNINSAAFAAARRLPPDDLDRLRTAYIDTLTDDDLSEPYAVLFVVARRAST